MPEEILMERQVDWEIVAPNDAKLPFSGLGRFMPSQVQREQLLVESQRLRARVYLADGAISEGDVDSDGRYVCAGDDKAWHVLAIHKGVVVGSVRISVSIPPTEGIPELFQVGEALLRLPSERQSAFWDEINRFLKPKADPIDAILVPGGWAVHQTFRRTNVGVNLVISPFLVARLFRNPRGLSLGSERNSSHRILQFMGHQALHPSGEPAMFFDSHYKCFVGILSSLRDCYSSAFSERIEAFARLLSQVPCHGPDSLDHAGVR